MRVVSRRGISKTPSWGATGDIVLSKTAVSKVTDILWKEFEEFQQRDLSGFTVEYLFLDAVYESLRAHFGMKDAVLCAWGIRRTEGAAPPRPWQERELSGLA